MDREAIHPQVLKIQEQVANDVCKFLRGHTIDELLEQELKKEREKTQLETKKESARNCLKIGISPNQVAEALNLPLDIVQQIEKEMG